MGVGHFQTQRESRFGLPPPGGVVVPDKIKPKFAGGLLKGRDARKYMSGTERWCW